MIVVSTKTMKLSKMVILLLKALRQKAWFFVHQISWMKFLLKTFKDEICLVDATYQKTTRYALPPFFMVVKTNVDYEKVGVFVICVRVGSS